MMPAPHHAPIVLTVTRPGGHLAIVGSDNPATILRAVERLAPLVPTDATWEVTCKAP